MKKQSRYKTIIAYLTQKKLFQLVLVISVITFGIILSGIFLSTSLKSTPKDQLERQWNIKTEHVLFGNFSPTITLYGVIESPQKATIRSALNADVKSVYIKDGSPLKHGQTLVLLDPKDYKLSVEQRQSELNLIDAKIHALMVAHKANLKAMDHEKQILKLEKKSVERLKTLLKSKHIAKETMDEAHQALAKTTLAVVLRQQSLDNTQPQHNQLLAQKKQAHALLKQAVINLERTHIKSPYDGVVIKKFIAHGDRVSPGSAILSLKPKNAEEVRVQAPPKVILAFIKALENDSDITASLSAHDQTIALRLDRLSPSIDDGKIGNDAFFMTKDIGSQLADGTVVSVLVTLPKLTAIYAAPIQALYGNKTIYQVANGRLKAVPIKRLGNKTDTKGQQLILFKSQTLDKTLPIMVSQLPNAYPGLKVNVIKPTLHPQQKAN